MPEISNIEQSLVKERLLTAEQLQTLKLEQERSSVSFVKALRQLKFVPEDILLDFLSKRFHLEIYNLLDCKPSETILSLLPCDFLWDKKIVPISSDDKEFSIGILDPLDIAVLEEVRFRTGLFIRPYLVREEELYRTLSKYYERRSLGAAETEVQVVEDDAAKPSVLEAVNLLLLQAMKFNASDIHIEPQAHKKMCLRLRIDGVMKEIAPSDPGLYNAVISRIKIMANLDITERRLPQDGRFSFSVEKENIDVRVSVIPTIQGEGIVLRLLKQDNKVLTLQELGMSRDNLEKFQRLIKRTSGIVLVTGPTGSGKTTTLYSSLLTLRSVETNIITIEDPVEYKLDFCRQIQVNSKINLTFASGLRSILRHDPDIIMVGEIRDLETATIAVQSALTGHLVLSTLHTNDSVSAITRLIDMGIEPFLIASCLNGVIAQRLVRCLCPRCKEISSVGPEGFEGKVYQPKGCQECLNTGFSGRIGIFEIMEMTSAINRRIVQKASVEEITGLCRQAAMKFLEDDGKDKVRAGLTTPVELMRVLGV